MIAVLLGWIGIGWAAPPEEAAPAWVVVEPPPKAARAVGGLPRRAVSWLLVDDQAQISEAPTRRYHRVVARVETIQGLSELGHVEVDHLPGQEDLRLLHLGIWRAGSWIDLSGELRQTELHRESELWQDIWDDLHTRVWIVPRLQVGDLLDYAVEVVGDNPVFGSERSLSWEMGWADPTGLRILRVAALGRPDLSLAVHGELPDMRGKAEGDRRIWTWRTEDLPAWPADPDSGETGAPWVEASSFQSWAGVVDWALPLYALNSEEAAVVDRLVGEMGLPTGDTEGDLLVALRFVQDRIRYVGLELGAGTHAPRPPSEVLRTGYGDCKDKAVLFVAMARRLGVEAWPELVDSGGAPGPAARVPSIGAFDHVIVALARPVGNLWVDPTRSFEGGPLREAWVGDLGAGLLIREGEGQLQPIQVAEANFGHHSTTRRWHLGVDSAEDWLEVEVEADGAAADELRAWLADTSPAESIQAAEAQLEGWGWIPDDTDPIEVEDDRERHRLRTRQIFRGVQGRVNEADGTSWLDLPSPRDLLALPEPDLQAGAPALFPAGQIEVDEVVLPPALAEVGEAWPVEGDAELDNAAFSLSYARRSRSGGLSLLRTLRVSQRWIDPEEQETYARLLDQLDALGERSVRLSKSPVPPAPSLLPSLGAGLGGLLLGLLLGRRSRRGDIGRG